MSSSEFSPRLATAPVVCATLEQIAREGARRSLQKAVEDEVAEYVEAHPDAVDPAGHRPVVRNGQKRPRMIAGSTRTGSGFGSLQRFFRRISARPRPSMN